MGAAQEKARQVAAKLRDQRLTRAAELVEASIEETFGYYAFPEEHWRRIRTNNPLERITIRELNLVPLINVLLVVLFFYMIISPMMSRGLDVNLPKSEATTIKYEDRIVITVTKAQEVFVEKERVDVAKLGGVLAILRKSKPQVNVYLRADRSAPYGAVVQVMDVVKRAGIDRLGMVTEPAGDERGK